MDLSLRHSAKKSKAMPCRHRPGVKTGAQPTEVRAERARRGEVHDPCSESSNAIALQSLTPARLLQRHGRRLALRHGG